MPRGYDRPLYIQPFDHRGSFQTKMFGWQSPLSDAQTAEIAGAKRVIYDGFLAALAAGVPKEKAGILVDEQFGAAILRDAASNNVVTACPAEKSGQEEFDFEYGEDFARHIEIFEPTFCKVLVRYNPQGDRALNEKQAARLKRLSDYLADKNRSRFMFELLVPPEKAQLDKLKGDKKVYDCEEIVTAARAGGRDRVSCIVLGRGEDDQKVRNWLAVAASVPGFIGFAVGRTTFWDPLVAWRSKKATREQAVAEIAGRYREFVDLFERTDLHPPSDQVRPDHRSSMEG